MSDRTKKTTDAAPAEAEPTLEARMTALKASVQRLEEGGSDLDAAFRDFEEGMRQAKALHKALESMERRIEKVIADQGIETVPEANG